MKFFGCNGTVVLSIVAAAFVVLSSMTTTESFSPSHATPQIFSLTTSHLTKQSKPYRMAVFGTSNRHKQRTSPTSLALAVNPVVVSAVGHVIGGNLAVPIVIDAVKTWYTKIPLPSFTPPNGIFAPTWLLLYSSLGVAVARVAAASSRGWKSPAVVLWGLHYLLNLAWAPLFFGRAKLRAGSVVNYFMVASLPFLFHMYAAVDRTAALLLLPYSAWLIFATILNQAVCKLNPMDGNGYNNAMFEADLANLQKQAANSVGCRANY